MTEHSRQQEIEQIEMGEPHVVVLGAGASRAAFPNGDKNGRRLPVMADFSDVVEIGSVLDPLGIPHVGRNFEDLYSQLSQDQTMTGVCNDLEGIIYRYFDSLALPDQPTIYDHLLLSLRPKDVIATFNWDPFLIQAARRNPCKDRISFLLFLHGNVRAGYCESDNVHGIKGGRCSRCGAPFSPSRLLYPTAQKDYDAEPMIQDAWRLMKEAFERAFMVTIFGYGAPKTDVAAIDALRQAWGSAASREMEEFEIIDIRDEAELESAWSPFIHTHHFRIHTDVYDSWILNYPRRTGEAYINQFINALFIEDNPIPRHVDLNDFHKWLEPLFQVEDSAK